MTQLYNFGIGQWDMELSVDAVTVDGAEHGKANILDSVLSVHHGGNGHCCVYCAE